MLQFVSLLGVSECLKPIKPDIIELAQLFTDDPSSLTRTDFQWRKLHHIIWTEISSTLKFWLEVANYRDAAGENPFMDITEMALSAQSLPHSNADVERAFGNMNLVKSKLRNKMKILTLKAILAFRYGMKNHESCCASYELPRDVLRKIVTIDSYKSTSHQGNTAQASCSGIYDEEEDWNAVDMA